MTTAVFIRNDSVPVDGHDVDVMVQSIDAGSGMLGILLPALRAPLRPGESVTTTVWRGNRLVVREAVPAGTVSAGTVPAAKP
jgi:hypothetical protein